MSQTANKADTGVFGENEYQPSGYGKNASELRKGRFLINREILPCIGTDVEYRAWTGRQQCLITLDTPARFYGLRRFVQPGLTIQPPYHGIPLAPELCLVLADNDESIRSLLEYYFVIDKDAPESEVQDWIDRAATDNLHNWAWYALKTRLGYEHWNEVPPPLLCDWARENKILHLLPRCYRNHNHEEETTH